MPHWGELFLPSVPLLEVFVRGTVIYLALTLMMRVVGQRESGELGITDLLVVVLVAEGANAGLTGEASSIVDSLLIIIVILLWSVAIDAVSYKWPKVSKVIKASPRPLIRDGQLNRHVMRREFMSYDEVMSQLRLQGIDKVDDVHRAYLEPSGMISIIPRNGESVEGAPEKPE